VLDLEELAAHRGSVLGNLPGRPQPTQKRFESLLVEKINTFEKSKAVFIEGESKKIGQLQVPDALMARMRASPCIVLGASLDTRVALLLDEYRHFLEDEATLGRQLDCLVPLHGREKIAAWKALAAAGAWPAFVCALLTDHYDPAYHRSSSRNFAQLAQARALKIESPEERAFAPAARTLTEEKVPA
jgi:tRNA 2-selenouridine synthase